MSLLAFATAAAMLYPVAVDDARLFEEGTVVSETAQAAMQDGEPPIFCMDLPERAGSHTRACLTRAEWGHALNLAEEDAAARESAAWRQRHIGLAEWYAGQGQ